MLHHRDPADPTPDFAYGAAALLRLMADAYRQWSSDVDWGTWEEREVFMLAPGVLLRGRVAGVRESHVLELAVELPQLDPPRRVVWQLSREELEAVAPLEARHIVESLYRETITSEEGLQLWPPTIRPYRLLDTCGVPVGTWVRVLWLSRGHQGFLPYNGRRGTVVGEVDPATIEMPVSWVSRPPQHILLVHFELSKRQQRPKRYVPMRGPTNIAYAEYELEILADV